MTAARIGYFLRPRWIAIAIALAAILDPRLPLPRSERPVVRVVSPESRDVTAIVAALTRAGFVVDPAQREAATLLVASTLPTRHPAPTSPAPTHPAPTHPAPTPQHPAPSTPLWVLDTAPLAPNVRIARAAAPAVRLPEQAVEIRVDVAAAGVAGQSTELVLEQNGIPVATAEHQWASGETRWQAVLRYLPPDVSATSLRVRATPAAGETSGDDNVADVAVPAVRGPIRLLIVEAAVTWPAVFIRRALEGEPAIAVSALQRAAKSVATRAGEPPPALTRSALAPFEVVAIGAPEELRAADLEALRWFVEQRGGVAIFIPDRAPSGRYPDLVGVSAFSSRALDTPAALGTGLQASELLIPAQLPPAATVLAAADRAPVVFSARRGAGAIVFAGALDAWRYRGDAFGEFWRGVLLSTAAAVPPALDVTAEPAMVRPGGWTTVVARMRELPGGDVIALPQLAARVVSPDARIDEAVRLWPTTEPGVYEGVWRARAAGPYNVTVSSGDLRGDAALTVAPSVRHASGADGEALALAAAATGGRAFPLADTPAMVEAMRQAHPPRRITRAVHPMRSPWWVLPFAGLLCAEWGIRRKRGLP
jgi:hypothetical protein